MRQLDFWALHLFQPSLLLGQRKEFRLGEEIAKFVGKKIDDITDGALNKYRPVEAKSVAKSMLVAAQGIEKGIAAKGKNTFDAIRNFGPACGVDEGLPGIIHLLLTYPNDLKVI